ncbi:MAG: DUF2232 domain-containing protein [Gemmatimonadota bacterium]
MGIPFLLLGIGLGMRRPAVFAVAVLAAFIVVVGVDRDGLWYLDRAWGVLAGGCFVALTLFRPSSGFSGRALGAVAVAAVVAAFLLSVQAQAWGTVEWVFRERMADGVGTAVQALVLFRGGDSLPPATVAKIYDAVEMQAVVFPAVLGVATLASLGVAWWLYVRLSTGSDQGVGPLRDFRFNDHLVWLFIGGLVLLLLRWEAVSAQIGANAVVFMGVLYALRGAAVVMFLSGGLSLLGYVLVAFGLVFLPPLVLTGAMVIGIGDTWLDVRRKVREPTP